ncbi:hypothetical protein AHiyo4_38280 [Arthrobacter sp. Hiyo4]|nr:hypothetical protein AHiyo4_38280 [Arthrobacter sp. Hiyo4]
MSAAQILQALCCDCGTVRTAKRGGPTNYQPPGFISECTGVTSLDIDERQEAGTLPADFEQYKRMLARLKCATCKQQTQHALIHPADYDGRDDAEHVDYSANFLIPTDLLEGH